MKTKISLILTIVMLISAVWPSSVLAAENRIVENPYFVTFLKDDGSLEYYEVINSQGFYVGFTRPGWRNDRLGRQVVDVARRGDGARAELWHLSGDIYYVDFYRANGSFIGSGSFSAAGIAGGQGNFVGNTGGATTVPAATTAGTTSVTTTTQVTTTSNNPVSVNTSVNVGGSGTASGIVHVVVRGETLAAIARYYGVSVYSIATANNIANVNLIYAGQRLVIR